MFRSIGQRVHLAAVVLIALALAAVTARLIASDSQLAKAPARPLTPIELRQLPGTDGPLVDTYRAATAATLNAAAAPALLPSTYSHEAIDSARIGLGPATSRPASKCAMGSPEVYSLDSPIELPLAPGDLASSATCQEADAKVPADGSCLPCSEIAAVAPESLLDRMLSVHAPTRRPAQTCSESEVAEQPCGQALEPQRLPLIDEHASPLPAVPLEDAPPIAARIPDHVVATQPVVVQQVDYVTDQPPTSERTIPAESSELAGELPLPGPGARPVVVPSNRPPRDMLAEPSSTISYVPDVTQGNIGYSSPMTASACQSCRSCDACQNCRPKRTGFGWKTHIMPWLEASHWGYPGEFEEPPLGRSVYAHMNRQVVKGEAARMVLYHYDFVQGIGEGDLRTELNARGSRQLRKIARMMQYNAAPLVIEPSSQPELDQERRAAVIEDLARLGADASSERVIIAYPEAIGMAGSEALDTYSNQRSDLLGGAELSGDVDTSVDSQ